MKLYLGLDLGTATGHALLQVGRLGHSVTYGTWNCKPTRFDSPSHRFQVFRMHLKSVLALAPDYVFFERVHRHLGVTAAHVYGGFLGAMQEECDVLKIPYTGLSVQEIKRYATGKGQASKDQITAAMKKRGYDPKNDNEADALAAVFCGWETKL